LQSAYLRHQSTEQRYTKGLFDFYAAADGQRVTFLGFLDVGAPVNCVDHDILVVECSSRMISPLRIVSDRPNSTSMLSHLSYFSVMLFFYFGFHKAEVVCHCCIYYTRPRFSTLLLTVLVGHYSTPMTHGPISVFRPSMHQLQCSVSQSVSNALNNEWAGTAQAKQRQNTDYFIGTRLHVSSCQNERCRV